MGWQKQITYPDDTDLLSSLKDRVLKEINCVQVGEIQAFNPSNQTATVRLTLKTVVSVSIDGTRTITEKPILAEVPVVILSGGSSYLTLPISAGDTCLVLFNDRDFDEWIISGGLQIPATGRTHDLSDAIAIVGIRTLQNVIDDYEANKVKLKFNDSNFMTIAGGQITLNTPLTQMTNDGQVVNNLAVGNNETVGNNITAGGIVTASAFATSGSGGGGGSVTCASVNASGDVSGATLTAGNGATGTFNIVTVVNGIVTGGS